MSSSTQTTAPIQTELAKPFGVLDPYRIRVLICRDQRDVDQVTDILQKTHGLEKSIEMSTAIFSEEDDYEFRYFEGPNIVRTYVLALGEREESNSKLKDLFNITALTRESPIIYVHPSAFALFKLATLRNFPVILFHDEEELTSYFKTDKYGNDQAEVLFYLMQSQTYVKEEIKTRKQFAEQKAASRGGDRRRGPPQERRVRQTPPKTRSTKKTKGQKKKGGAPNIIYVEEAGGWLIPGTAPPQQRNAAPAGNQIPVIPQMNSLGVAAASLNLNAEERLNLITALLRAGQ